MTKPKLLRTAPAGAIEVTRLEIGRILRAAVGQWLETPQDRMTNHAIELLDQLGAAGYEISLASPPSTEPSSGHAEWEDGAEHVHACARTGIHDGPCRCRRCGSARDCDWGEVVPLVVKGGLTRHFVVCLRCRALVGNTDAARHVHDSMHSDIGRMARSARTKP